MKKRVVVLGGGLAGISTAYHLSSCDFDTIVFEKSDAVGGTARTVHIDGFTFDFSGHLLHLHNDYTKKLINDLLPDNLYSCARKAAIFTHDKLIPYPFQVHTYSLPENVIQDCVNGFKRSVKKYSDPNLRATSLPFGEWSKCTFGTGITKHFMKPYNEKLWRTKSTNMTAEWCGIFVPQPKVEEVENGAKRHSDKEFGYNTTFLYPKKGGIQVLSQALGKGLNVQLETAFQELNWKKRKIKIADNEMQEYDFLVSSIPLPELLKRMKDLPSEIEILIPKLRWTSVLCTNIGVDRANISDKTWIYFPEKKFRFYRVGFRQCMLKFLTLLITQSIGINPHS
jgi:protoporphyrinogen oxidase